MEKASLTKHEESHMPNEQRIHTCDICQKTFTHMTDLSMHKKYHDPDKKFDCEVCGREFNRLNNLQRHMMVHQQANKVRIQTMNKVLISNLDQIWFIDTLKILIFTMGILL